ncbi:uncharacterized protein F58A4.6 [Stomoxys calcitrans]|uniref:uncharacterized protein F58A4.6 n=1 Tax=Stomoxys calcitrans TaxID=35570 RepID=UPI0027E374F8|nr:uncharacterized protein F58A4.6 [Stomoxys calcitrans]
MELIICVSNYWQERKFYRLYAAIEEPIQQRPSPDKSSYEIEVVPSLKSCKNAAYQHRILRRRQVSIDGIQFFYLLKELFHFQAFKRLLCTHPHMNDIHLLWLQIIPPARDIIDWKWNHMLARKLWERIETDYLMSWLSTLGGGYSALGEQFSTCAEVAGKISQKQLCIGIQLGDPFLQSRCLLYYSISLIQVGRLRTAKYLIRKQYAFALANVETDGRLLKMCEGIWMRLQYEYGLRFKKKPKL